MIAEGRLQYNCGGRKKRPEWPGSVAFVASNEVATDGVVGTNTARYLLFALGPDWNYRQNPSGVPARAFRAPTRRRVSRYLKYHPAGLDTGYLVDCIILSDRVGGFHEC